MRACATSQRSFVSPRRVSLEARGMMQAVSTRAMPSDTLYTTAKGAAGGVTLSYGEDTYGGGDLSQ